VIEGINESTALVIGVCTATAFLVAGYKVLWFGKNDRPGWVKAFLRDIRGFRDVILGDEGVRDPSTGEVVRAAQPGIGTRMAHQETQTELLTVTVTKLVDQQMFLQGLEKRVDGHEKRLEKIEAAVVERVVTKVESTAAWRAMEAATNSTPDEHHEENPDEG
jgi:hypothetical protein